LLEDHHSERFAIEGEVLLSIEPLPKDDDRGQQIADLASRGVRAAEIARRVGEKPNTVRKRLSRQRRKSAKVTLRLVD
jgi:DNA-directed RNA polymerase specialized sigma24 family protein